MASVRRVPGPRHRWPAWASCSSLLLLALAAGPVAAAGGAAPAERPALMRVDLPPGGTLPALAAAGVPVFGGVYTGTDGVKYALAIGAPSAVKQAAAAAGANVPAVLDTDADAAARAGGYWVASAGHGGSGSRGVEAQQRAALRTSAVLDDGAHLVLRGGRATERAADLGLELERLGDAPLSFAPPHSNTARAQAALPPLKPLVLDATKTAALKAIADSVKLEDLLAAHAPLIGRAAVSSGGSAFNLTTRHTKSGASIEAAVDYVTAALTKGGLSNVGMQPWRYRRRYSGRNAFGEVTGRAGDGRVLLVTAHIDSRPKKRAVGADDDASGVAAALVAARALARVPLNATVRFVLFTGEEQGMLGSYYYAQALKEAGGQLPFAVLNCDMLAWSTPDGDPGLDLNTRSPSDGEAEHRADTALAEAFISVASAVGLRPQGTAPVIRPDGERASDHSRFWDIGIPGILISEDWYSDPNPHYHKRSDTFETLNQQYWLANARVLTALAAALAGLA